MNIIFKLILVLLIIKCSNLESNKINSTKENFNELNKIKETDLKFLNIETNPLNKSSIELQEINKDESKIKKKKNCSIIENSNLYDSDSDSFIINIISNDDTIIDIQPIETSYTNLSLDLLEQQTLLGYMPTVSQQIQPCNRESVIGIVNEILSLQKNNAEPCLNEFIRVAIFLNALILIVFFGLLIYTIY